MPVPNIYEEVAAVHGTGALSVPWGTHNDTFHMVLLVRSNGQPIATPVQSNPADEDAGADRGIWHLAGEAYVGTPGAAGAVGVAMFWCRSKVGAGMSNVTVADSGDSTSARGWMLQNVTLTGNPINWAFTATVDPASDEITIGPLPDTTVQNCLILGSAGNGIDSDTNQGSSGWANASLDTIGFAGHMNTSLGNGGGTQSCVGEKAVAGSCGTITHLNGWPTPTLQANVVMAISDTETPGGTIESRTGTAAGTSSATGEAVATVRRTGSSAGAATATGANVAIVRRFGTAAGTSSALGLARGTQSAAGTAIGTSTAQGEARAIVRRSGTAAGAATATGERRLTVRRSGTAAGSSSAVGQVPYTIERRDGTAAGSSSAVGVARATVSWADRARGSLADVNVTRGALVDVRTTGSLE